MMRTIRIVLSTAVMLLVQTSWAQTSKDVVLPGDACVGYTTSGNSDFLHSQYGTENTSSTADLASCPVIGMDTIGITTSSAFIKYQDNSSDSSQGDLNCFWYGYRPNTGSLFQSSTLHSCSTTGGCSTANASFTSTGNFDQFNWSTVLNSNMLFNVDVIIAVCNLPPSSWIIDYSLSWTE